MTFSIIHASNSFLSISQPIPPPLEAPTFGTPVIFVGLQGIQNILHRNRAQAVTLASLRQMARLVFIAPAGVAGEIRFARRQVTHVFVIAAKDSAAGGAEDCDGRNIEGSLDMQER